MNPGKDSRRVQGLDEQTAQWVKEGHITSAQRDAILASESMPTRPDDDRSEHMGLRKEGPAAEVFVLLMGAFVALLAGGAVVMIGQADLVVFALTGVLMAMVGLALLIGVRGGALLADIAFASGFWLLGFAAINPSDPGWQFYAPFIAPVIAGIGIIRVLRLVLVVAAFGLTYVYVAGAIPAFDDGAVYVGFFAFVVIGSAAIAWIRPRVRRWLQQKIRSRHAPSR